MARTYAYSADFDKEVESLFKDAKLLGEGHNGIVYEVPGNKAIKIFINKKVCKSEAEILYKVKKSKYFPNIYKNRRSFLYMIRWMVMPLYEQRCFRERKKIAELERSGGKYGKLFGSTDIGQLDCDCDHCDYFNPGNPYDSQTYERGRRLLWRTRSMTSVPSMNTR